MVYQAKAQETWGNVSFDSAVAVLYNAGSFNLSFGNNLVKIGQTNPTIISNFRKKLSQKQMQKVLFFVNGNYDDTDAFMNDSFCGYTPRHGVLFYQSDQITHYLELCYDCDEFRIFPKNPLTKTDLIQRIEPLFKALRIPIHQDDSKYIRYKDY